MKRLIVITLWLLGAVPLALRADPLVIVGERPHRDHWRERRWREHEWREHEWRERHWREHHRWHHHWDDDDEED